VRIEDTRDGHLNFALLFLGSPQLQLTFLQVEVTVVVSSEFLFYLKLINYYFLNKYKKKAYLDLDEEISKMFPESCQVLVQVEESLHRHFELELCQVREGIVK